MKNKMEEIDELIKDTLSKEEAAFYNSLDEQNVLEMFFGLFKGKNAWIIIVMNIMIFVFLGLMVYCGIQFLNIETTIEMMRWGFGCLVSMLAMSMLKLYAWMQMDKNAILREMKRLELQVMSLSGKIED
jgi:hypothetical protein